MCRTSNPFKTYNIRVKLLNLENDVGVLRRCNGNCLCLSLVCLSNSVSQTISWCLLPDPVQYKDKDII